MWREPSDQRHPFDLPVVEVPLALESTWEYKGRVGYVLASWQTSEQDVTLRPKPYSQEGKNFRLVSYGDNAPGGHSLQESGPLPAEVRLRVPPLSAFMLEQTLL